jgi:hypothetical protein
VLAALIGLAALLSASHPPDASAAGGVLVVGDSLEVGTSPYLRGLLHGIPLTVDAQTSRPSSTGVEVLRSRLQSGDPVVVFDLGTNDDPAQPQALAREGRDPAAWPPALARSRAQLGSTLADHAWPAIRCP